MKATRVLFAALAGALGVPALPVEMSNETRDVDPAALPFTCGNDQILEICSRPNANSYCNNAGQFVSDFDGTCSGCLCTGSGSGGCNRCAKIPVGDT